MVNQDLHTSRSCGDGIAVIVVAAGSGTRFGSAMPKQFLTLAGRPVLLRTVETINRALPQATIVLVLSEVGVDCWDDITADYTSAPACRIVLGGDTRSQSVANALEALASDTEPPATVLVHDGARPLVHPDMVRELCKALSADGIDAAVPVLPLTEAIASLTDADAVLPADRAQFRTVQTPQAFKFELLHEAYRRAHGDVLADDAAIVAKYGDAPIHTVPGHSQNIKITNPTDIAVAEVLLANQLPYNA
ncbi:MAG: 2-C-methyl-D-erythritol 4-phosphate cytidylyltransferase [Muribaculaceae bacterium]|nr:2-C-methyl-D-erythritol 4-phosphate cytidylyltransferase [Muribaculaceae bacterium]